MQVDWNQGIALLFHLADQSPDFVLVHEQLLGPDAVGADVGRCGLERADLAADHEQLAIADHHVSFGELHLAFAHGLDLPALQYHAGLVAFLEGVIEGGFLVLGNAIARGRFFACHNGSHV